VQAINTAVGLRAALDRELIGDVQSTLHTTALDFVPHSLSMHSITQPNLKDQRSADCVDSETFRTPTLMSNWTIRILLFELAVTVHQCLNGRAPPYLSEHCNPVSSADTRRHLRSANCHLLAVPRFRLNSYGRRSFSVAAWNSLPVFIRDPTSSTDCFRRLLKTYLWRVTSASSALVVLNDYALYKSTQSLTHRTREGEGGGARRDLCLLSFNRVACG